MKWVLAESDTATADKLSEQTGFHPLIARLMVIRGITDAVAARTFISCELSHLSDPDIFIDMQKAVHRIRGAIASRERIAVYGDYDVDGITGAAILFLALKSISADVEWYIPDRMTEGYGLHAAALQKLRASGIQLVISVDCGITANAEADLAREIGLDLIITDHHELLAPHSEVSITDGKKPAPETHVYFDSNALLPRAYAVLHPVLVSPGALSSVYNGMRELTGAGVAFKLAQALLSAGPTDDRLEPYLGLAALGTVGDVGRIVGENRILVKYGLEVLSNNSPAVQPGIAALKRISGLTEKKINSIAIGFTLAPRLNASGRLEKADMAFRLLTTDSGTEATELAIALDAINKERQSVEERILEDAQRICRKIDISATGALILSSRDWHPGVVGIVASRIADEFYRPTGLIAIKDGVGKGSARSIPGFDLYHALRECSDLLLGYGGHRYAAGFSIAEENIPRLRERLNAIALERIGKDGFVRSLLIDTAMSLNDLTFDLVRAIERLGPFGQGNPEPRLGVRGLDVLSSRIVGNNHLRLRVKQGNGSPFDAIAFKQGNRGNHAKSGSRIAAVFTPRISGWNGKQTVELEIRDLKLEK